jgi:protein-disulfide isomerase
MSKLKPALLILVAIVVAGGVAVFMSRESAETETAAPGTPAPGGGRFKGPADAPVTLTEFGDYQCPACRSYHPIIDELMRRYPTQLKLQFHHFPLVQIHANAMLAAQAAEAAGDQGKFWEMHDQLFLQQHVWASSTNARAFFVSLAGQLGLNASQFSQSLDSTQTRDRILADVAKGRDANIPGTPTFFMNGQLVPGTPGVDELAQHVERILNPTAP